MRTTLCLDDNLIDKAKKIALKNNRTLTSLFEEALRQYLSSISKPSKKTKRIKLPTVDLGGTQPGVNLDSNAELLSLMEDQNDSYRR